MCLLRLIALGDFGVLLFVTPEELVVLDSVHMYALGFGVLFHACSGALWHWWLFYSLTVLVYRKSVHMSFGMLVEWLHLDIRGIL